MKDRTYWKPFRAANGLWYFIEPSDNMLGPYLSRISARGACDRIKAEAGIA